MTAIDRHSIARPLRAWAYRNTSRIVWGIGFAWLCFFWGMVIAYVGAPALRSLIDTAIERPAICAGLSAGECGEAMEAR